MNLWRSSQLFADMEDVPVEDLPCVGACLKEEGNVAGGDVQSGHGDDEADQASNNWAHDVPEFLSGTIRVEGVDQRDNAGEQPRRAAHQECWNIVESKSTGERWLRQRLE